MNEKAIDKYVIKNSERYGNLKSKKNNDKLK